MTYVMTNELQLLNYAINNLHVTLYSHQSNYNRLCPLCPALVFQRIFRLNQGSCERDRDTHKSKFLSSSVDAIAFNSASIALSEAVFFL